MKFTITQEQLLRPLQTVGGIVERRSVYPILSNFLFRLTPSTLSIIGSDTELEMIMHLNIDNAEPGETTLPARKLIDICRALPAGAPVEIAVKEGRAVIRSGRSRFTLATLPASEFPELKEPELSLELSLKQGQIKQLIDKTAFSMAHQDVRYFLNGICLEIGGGQMRSVATDGHRLALCALKDGISTDGNEDHRIIIPRKAVMELARLVDDSDQEVKLQIGDSHIRFLFEESDTVFSSKLVDGQYPDYLQVIPTGNPNELVADREQLLSTLKRTSILSNEKFRSVRLVLGPDGNMLRVVAHNQEQEEAEEELEVQYQGDELEIAFNVHYLIDVLQAVEGSEVRILFGDANSSCLVVEELEAFDCRYVIMPMRL